MRGWGVVQWLGEGRGGTFHGISLKHVHSVMSNKNCGVQQKLRCPNYFWKWLLFWCVILTARYCGCSVHQNWHKKGKLGFFRFWPYQPNRSQTKMRFFSWTQNIPISDDHTYVRIFSSILSAYLLTCNNFYPGLRFFNWWWSYALWRTRSTFSLL